MTDKSFNIGAKPARSVVSILVVDVVNSSAAVSALDPEDVQLFLDMCFDHIRNKVRTNGGTIVHFTGDGGVAVFGWPDGQEKHAEFAIKAAQDIIHNNGLKRPDGGDVAFRIGIHSGTAVVRTVDTGGGSRPDAIGNAVHIAAAMEKAAPENGIIVSTDTVELCQREVQGDSIAVTHAESQLSALLVKGMSDQQKSFLTQEARIFGRRHELELIDKALPEAAKDVDSLCFIGGPGIGKSRLLAAAAAKAQAQDTARIVVFCHPLMRLQSYFIASQIIRKLAASENKNNRFQTILETLEIPETDRKIARQIVLQSSEDSETFTQRRVERAMQNVVLELLQNQPILICLEDIHHMDTESAELLFAIRTSGAKGFAVMASSRPQGEKNAGLVAQTVIEVKALEADDMLSMAKGLIPEDQFDPALLEALIARADGVPFILEQLAKSFVSNKKEVNFDPLPQTIESSIHAQIYELNPELRYSVQLLSVIGNGFKTTEIAQMMEMSAAEFTSIADALRQKGLVTQLDDFSLRFSHDIILDAVQRTLHRKEKAGHHQKIYAVLLTQKSDWDVKDLTLAYHAREAGQLEVCLKHYFSAAKRAVRTSAAFSMDTIFDEAMAVIEKSDKFGEPYFVDFILLAFDSLQQIGKYNKINAYLPKAIELAKQHGRPDKECMGLGHLTTIRWYEGKGTEGIESGTRAKTLADNMQVLPLVFYSHFQLANVYYNFGNLDEAIALQSGLVEKLAGDLKSAHLGAAVIPGSIARSFLAFKLTDKGRFEEAKALAKEAIEIAQGAHQPYSITMANMSMGRLFNAQGQYEQALPYNQEAYAYVHGHGLVTANAIVTAQLATSLRRTGHADEALDVLDACFASGTMPLGAKFTTIMTQIAYYESLRFLDRTEEAETARQAALKTAREIGDPISEAKALSIPARYDAMLRLAPQSHLDDLQAAIALAKKYNFTLPHPMPALEAEISRIIVETT